MPVVGLLDTYIVLAVLFARSESTGNRVILPALMILATAYSFGVIQ